MHLVKELKQIPFIKLHLKLLQKLMVLLSERFLCMMLLLVLNVFDYGSQMRL